VGRPRGRAGRPAVEVAPSQVVRVLEVLRQAEAAVEGLAREVVQGRGVVKLPKEGYPLKWIERDALQQALVLAGWVQQDAAALLHISPRVMHYQIRVHGVRLPPDVRRKRWKETG